MSLNRQGTLVESCPVVTRMAGNQAMILNHSWKVVYKPGCSDPDCHSFMVQT